MQLPQKPRYFVPVNAKPFDPPQLYLRWWIEVADCAGIVPGGDTPGFKEVQWFVADSIVPGFDYESVPDHIVTGLYSRGAIYVRRGYRMSKTVIQHEMLHALGVRHDYVKIWECTENPSTPYK